MGSEQIRQSGTLGGNICNGSPCADSAPPLFVLEATVRVMGPEGERRLKMGELMVGPKKLGLRPGEIVVAFELPSADATLRGVFLKKRRVAMDLALVNLAALLCMSNHGRVGEEVRLCAGAVGPVPMRLTAVEQLLEGKQPTDTLLAEARKLASETVQPIGDLRAGAGYRRHITGVFVERALRELRGAHP
jgi:carbon-monoxide dehydrogenase medium subunit